MNPSDINATIATDFAICFGAAGQWSTADADDDWFMDAMAVDASTRLMNYLGVDMDNTLLWVFSLEDGYDVNRILAPVNAEGTEFGLVAASSVWRLLMQ